MLNFSEFFVLFKAVGVKKAEDINRMVDFFLPYTYCHICAGGGEEEVPLNSEESEMFMQSYNPVEGYSKGIPNKRTSLFYLYCF